jgi:hypothetical protein
MAVDTQNDIVFINVIIVVLFITYFEILHINEIKCILHAKINKELK